MGFHFGRLVDQAALGYFGRRFFGGHLADVLILCDGGCDVLLTGRETGLATPVEELGIQGGKELGRSFDLSPFFLPECQGPSRTFDL